MHICIRGSEVSADAVSAALERRAEQRKHHYEKVGVRMAQRAEREHTKNFEERGSKRGLTPVASFTPHHAASLTRQYGDNWMSDKKAIAHAAERDPSVAAQRRRLEYAADAIRANSR